MWALEHVCFQIVSVDEKTSCSSCGSCCKFDFKDVDVFEFTNALNQRAPAYYPKFKYTVGTQVQPKGPSQKESNVYQICKLVPFLNRSMAVGRAYKCMHVDTGETEVFEEDDLALV
jgi:hypothetical protein